MQLQNYITNKLDRESDTKEQYQKRKVHHQARAHMSYTRSSAVPTLSMPQCVQSINQDVGEGV